MAITVYRSCNADLHAGMTDGAYKKYAPHRGGYVEGCTAGVRSQMSGIWHGFHETELKYLPDGRPDHPPYYVDVTPMDVENV